MRVLFLSSLLSHLYGPTLFNIIIALFSALEESSCALAAWDSMRVIVTFLQHIFEYPPK